MSEFEIYDLKVVVHAIEGRSVCGMQVGDYFEIRESSKLIHPRGQAFLHLCPERGAAAAACQTAPAGCQRLAGKRYLGKPALILKNA